MQKLYTAAGEELRGVPWTTYPRPQMVREDWLCLNGEWSFTFRGKTRSIRVPFCPESLLSGADTEMAYGEDMVYRRVFSLPETWAGKRVLIHFGAVSRIALVRVNGVTAAAHDESYLPFSADITDLVRPGENELVVRAVNDISHRHPWGKQKADRGGMWYTPVSGIWQTVWLEAVPQTYIRLLSISTGADSVEITAEGVRDGTVLLDGREYPLEDGRARIEIGDPHLWSPEDPWLYRFSVKSGGDRVESYFALRTLSVERADGVPRLCLNGKPYFFHGLLDQGYWSDGLYTPADPGSYERDILAMKALGFNTLRKHIKIEPAQFYYDCDRLGMIVFQDMVSSGEYNYLRDTVLPTLGFQRRNDRRLHRDPEQRKIFLRTMDNTVRLLKNHPCICVWTIFNEGWGQFRSAEAYRQLRRADGTRFVNTASGWFIPAESDVESMHYYYQKPRLRRSDRPQLITEFGGYVWKVPEHSFNQEKTYGYKIFADRDAFVSALRSLYMDRILPLVPRGLCAAIYTQVSDVEDETNGLVTFDRRVQKVLPEELCDIAGRLRAALDAKD